MIRKLLLFILSFQFCFIYSNDLKYELEGLNHLLGSWKGYWSPGKFTDRDKPQMEIESYVLASLDGNLIQIIFYMPSVNFPVKPKDNCAIVHYKWNHRMGTYISIQEGLEKSTPIIYSAASRGPWETKWTFFQKEHFHPTYGKGQKKIKITPVDQQFNTIYFSQYFSTFNNDKKSNFDESVLVLNKIDEHDSMKLKLHKMLNRKNPPSPNNQNEYLLYSILEDLPINWLKFQLKIKSVSNFDFWTIEEESEDFTDELIKLDLDEDSSSPTMTQDHKTDEFPLS